MNVSMLPNYVNSSTAEFYLLPESPGFPLCGVSDPYFRLIFSSTWATNGPGSFGKETSYLFVQMQALIGLNRLSGFIRDQRYMHH